MLLLPPFIEEKEFEMEHMLTQIRDGVYNIAKWCDDHYMLFIFLFMFAILFGMTAWLLLWEYADFTKTY